MPEVLDKDSIKALSVDTRLDIVKLLAKRPYTASEIAKKMDKHVTTVTEHLNVLEKAGIVARKDSTNKWVYYELTKKGDHLFKPNIYSWTIVFVVSLAAMVAGSRFLFAQTVQTAAETMKSVSVPAASTGTEEALTTAAIGINPLALFIIALGTVGILVSLNKFRNIF